MWPKVVHRLKADGEWSKSIQLNLGRKRWISPGSVIHESVAQRLSDSRVGYKPGNLPDQRSVIPDRCVAI